ncbi:hypothetical protein RGQ29_017654 [Quercus rubra]|uniref:Uncharacterized protein n=1 Tax=Quercus rubra TaxID=3512 RepID=A0AAN7FN82_QUERU|nr:hypothetical protein RGQ29_017654 [Quercus rubra]
MKGKKILQVICKLAWSIVVSYVWLQRNAPVFNGNVKSKIPCFSDVLVNIQEWEDQHKHLLATKSIPLYPFWCSNQLQHLRRRHVGLQGEKLWSNYYKGL